MFLVFSCGVSWADAPEKSIFQVAPLNFKIHFQNTVHVHTISARAVVEYHPPGSSLLSFQDLNTAKVTLLPKSGAKVSLKGIEINLPPDLRDADLKRVEVFLTFKFATEDGDYRVQVRYPKTRTPASSLGGFLRAMDHHKKILDIVDGLRFNLTLKTGTSERIKNLRSGISVKAFDSEQHGRPKLKIPASGKDPSQKRIRIFNALYPE